MSRRNIAIGARILEARQHCLSQPAMRPWLRPRDDKQHETTRHYLASDSGASSTFLLWQTSPQGNPTCQSSQPEQPAFVSSILRSAHPVMRGTQSWILHLAQTEPGQVQPGNPGIVATSPHDEPTFPSPGSSPPVLMCINDTISNSCHPGGLQLSSPFIYDAMLSSARVEDLAGQHALLLNLLPRNSATGLFSAIDITVEEDLITANAPASRGGV